MNSKLEFPDDEEQGEFESEEVDNQSKNKQSLQNIGSG